MNDTQRRNDDDYNSDVSLSGSSRYRRIDLSTRTADISTTQCLVDSERVPRPRPVRQPIKSAATTAEAARPVTRSPGSRLGFVSSISNIHLRSLPTSRHPQAPLCSYLRPSRARRAGMNEIRTKLMRPAGQQRRNSGKLDTHDDGPRTNISGRRKGAISDAAGPICRAVERAAPGMRASISSSVGLVGLAGHYAFVRQFQQTRTYARQGRSGHSLCHRPTVRPSDRH